jgi:hypothetical protein
MCVDICNKANIAQYFPLRMETSVTINDGWIDFTGSKLPLVLSYFSASIFSCSTDNNTSGRIKLTVRKSGLDGDLPTMACITKCRAITPLPRHDAVAPTVGKSWNIIVLGNRTPRPRHLQGAIIKYIKILF